MENKNFTAEIAMEKLMKVLESANQNKKEIESKGYSVKMKEFLIDDENEKLIENVSNILEDYKNDKELFSQRIYLPIKAIERRKYFLITLAKEYNDDDILINNKNTILVDLLIKNELDLKRRLREYFKSRVVLNIDELSKVEYELHLHNKSMQNYRPNL